jgi:hypothetical protein
MAKTIVYKTPGRCRGNKGNTYDSRGCEESEVEGLLNNGWFSSLSEAEGIKNEVKKDEVKKASNEKSEGEELYDQFKKDPKVLTKEQHIELGAKFGVKLTMNFKEDTMISKINEAIAAE